MRVDVEGKKGNRLCVILLDGGKKKEKGKPTTNSFTRLSFFSTFPPVQSIPFNGSLVSVGRRCAPHVT